jgi:hypothetical protein
MCFCATASFSLGAALLPAGAYCVAEAARKGRDYLALGAIPLVFAAQQFSEGFVWLGLAEGTSRAGSGYAAVLAFLFFALVFWPVGLPLSVIPIQRNRGRPLALLAALGAGIGLSLFLPLAFEPDRYLVVAIRQHSIFYDFTKVPVLQVVPEMVLRVLYLATIVVPFGLCADRRLRQFGAAVLASALLSQVVFWYAFISIWCFFAAALSLYLAVFLRGLPARPAASAGWPPDPVG